MSTEILHKELEQMWRIMNELRLNSSEKDAEIIKLTMHLQDQRIFNRETKTNFLGRDLFANSVQSGFNTSVGHSKPSMQLRPDHARSQNPYYKQRRDSMQEESRIEPLETPSLVTS